MKLSIVFAAVTFFGAMAAFAGAEPDDMYYCYKLIETQGLLGGTYQTNVSTVHLKPTDEPTKWIMKEDGLTVPMVQTQGRLRTDVADRFCTADGKIKIVINFSNNYSLKNIATGKIEDSGGFTSLLQVDGHAPQKMVCNVLFNK